MDFCVVVGAIFEGKPVIGVIFEPATESMYTAAVNTDAQLNASRINVSDDELNKMTSVSIDSHFPDSQIKAIFKLIKTTRFRNLGTTAMHLAYVAKGGLVGAVVSREVSRLSRTDKDWCHLLEVCQIFDTLILDEERVYDLSDIDDQLVLGLTADRVCKLVVELSGFRAKNMIRGRGVALDTLQQIESHLVMRHYDGFLKKGKIRGRSM